MTAGGVNIQRQSVLQKLVAHCIIAMRRRRQQRCGLLARVSDYSQDDPVHSTEDLYRGIDIAHHTFEFPVAALALLYRHRRPAFIAVLSGLARAAPGLSADWPPLSQMRPAPQECPKCPAGIRVLLEMLREVDGGGLYLRMQASDFRGKVFWDDRIKRDSTKLGSSRAWPAYAVEAEPVVRD